MVMLTPNLTLAHLKKVLQTLACQFSASNVIARIIITLTSFHQYSFQPSLLPVLCQTVCRKNHVEDTHAILLPNETEWTESKVTNPHQSFRKESTRFVLANVSTF